MTAERESCSTVAGFCSLLLRFLEKMKLFLLLCTSSMLVFGEITNSTEKNHDGLFSLSDNNELPITDGAPSLALLGKCPENMEPYVTLTEVRTTWKCKCKSGYLYFPSIDSCHEAYRQGPCPPGQYVRWDVEDKVTRCIENPCSTDGLVPYNGGCHALGGFDGPCAGFGVLAVEDNVQLVCHMVFMRVDRPSFPENVGFNIDAPSIKTVRFIACPLGERRASNGDCLKVLI